MNKLRRALDLVLFSNLFIGLGALSLTLTTIFSASLDLPSLFPLLGLIFFSTVFIYSFHAWFTIKRNAGRVSLRLNWISKNAGFLKVSSLVSGLACLSTVPFLNINTLLFLVPCFFLSLFYTLKININGVRFSLKEIPFLKVLLVAFVWATVTVLLPFSESNLSLLNGGSLLLWFERFFLISALCVPFDIRDLEQDRNKKVLTFPVYTGVYYTRIISVALFCVFLILAFYNANYGIGIAVIIPSLFFILGAGKIKNDYFYNIGGDGVLVLYGMLFFALRMVLA